MKKKSFITLTPGCSLRWPAEKTSVKFLKALNHLKACIYVQFVTITFTLIDLDERHDQGKLILEKSKSGLLNIRLMLSSSFRCDQIYKNEIYNFGHTLLCYLSRT